VDTVSVSTVAMDAVSVSTVAMDAVSVSDIALDAIWASAVAWDIVKAKSMAVGKFAVGRAGLDGADYADIDAVAASQTAMDAVSTSQTAMDAVSTSSTALDSIWNSQLAWDTVKTKAMAVGKFVVGRAGLDGANYADIDAVVASQSAMDAVAASIDARSAVFESDYALGSLWATTPGARTILESGGTPTLPHFYDYPRSGSSGLHVRIEDGADISLPSDAASALELETVDSDDNTAEYNGLTLTLDLSNSATLEFQQRTDTSSGTAQEHGVRIDGSVTFSTSDSNAWTNRSIDVSGYNGTHDVQFYAFNNSWAGGAWTGYFTDINLL
jgi:hypothetical protein